jgi:hypothetical protein
VSVPYVDGGIMETGSIGPLAANTSEIETLINVKIIAGNECYHTLFHICTEEKIYSSHSE